MMLAYCIIRFDLPGPAIYKQERVGKDERFLAYSSFAPCESMRKRNPVLS